MDVDFASVYERWFDDVQRWLAAMGAPDADVDDLTQDVFVVVERQLGRFDGGNLPGWLYGIARRVAAAHRRRAWIRQLFLREEGPRARPEEPTPATLLEQKQARELVAHLLARMTNKRRRVFALFEIEGYSGEEIAALECVALNTVWTRLHHARKDFMRLASALAEKDVAS